VSGIQKDEVLNVLRYIKEERQTSPPARYTEATLIKTLEKNNIGRPSTYAPTISILLNRGYVKIEKRALIPLKIGRVVYEILMHFFPEIIKTGFTAKMEDDLDRIATGDRKWTDVLQKFYDDYKPLLLKAEKDVSEVNEIFNRILVGNRTCPNCKIPLTVKKGRYDFNVWDGVETSLPLSIYVSEEGTFKTEFSTEQANMEGQASSTFTFNATLMNQTAEKQLYAFRSQAPRGWNVAFKVNYKQVTSTEIEANTTQDITIEIDPPDQTEAGTYNIPVIASTTGTNAKLNLEVVITGSYDMELTTPTGLVSSRITAGSEKRLELTVRNTGSSELKNIRFSASKPRDWEVVFEPETLLVLMPGNTGNVHATVKAPRKTIAGDYVTNLTARTPEVTKEVAFRISVRTPILIGWLGVLIIIAAVGVVYYLFRKYGRR